MVTPCSEVFPTFRLNEKSHIYPKFKNLYFKLQAYLGPNCVERVKCLETYKSGILAASSYTNTLRIIKNNNKTAFSIVIISLIPLGIC